MSQNLLDAINIVCSSVGTGPFNQTNVGHPHIGSAKQFIDKELRDVQVEGWWFNKQVSRTFVVDEVTSEILLPPDIIEVEVVNDIVKRGNRLYDNENYTYIFDEDKEVDVLVSIGIDELPIVVYNYIIAVASVKFFMKESGDAVKLQELKDERLKKLVILKRKDLQMKDVNSMASPSASNLLISQPQG